MKKITRLVNYKTKQTKNVKTYNPFDTGNAANNDDDNGNDEMSHTKSNKNKKKLMKTKTQLEPIVHNYNKTNNAIAKTTKPKVGGNKLLTILKKSKQMQHQQQSQPQQQHLKSTAIYTSPTTSRLSYSNNSSSRSSAGNNINYASLNRMRNSSSTSQSTKANRSSNNNNNNKRKWPFLWWKRYGRNRKSKTWRLKKSQTCWRFLQKLYCCRKRSSYQYDSEDDDDIDAKFNAYVCEMKRRDAAEEAEAKKSLNSSNHKESCLTNSSKATTLTSMTSHITDTNLKTNPTLTFGSSTTTTNASLLPAPPPTTAQLTNLVSTSFASATNDLSCNNRVSFAGIDSHSNNNIQNSQTFIQRRHSQHLPSSRSSKAQQQRAWTWDDSLRSNSDRFLETLEEDVGGDFIIIPESIIETASTSVNSSRCSVVASRIRPSLQQLLTCNNEDDDDVDMVHVHDDDDDDFVVIPEEEAKAAAEELSQSPVMGQRTSNDPTSSPIASRGSGHSSDNWPTQSDEDIDRLVAMHQNRSSLSSLGLRSDSMASVYSGAGEGRYGTVVVKGQVEFGMQYNYKLGALEIRVVRCKDLAAVDSKRNRSDPYVKVYLLPDKSKAGKRKTKVKKHTLNPIFDEILRFHIPISNLESRTLWLTVWHSDMFGRNDFLGEVSVNLQGRVFDNPQSQWYLLQERSEPFDEVATYRGDIVVGLKYVPPEGSKSKFMRAASLAAGGGLRKFGSIKAMTASKTDRTAKGGQLHVLVKEAKHLTPIKPTGSCDSFCKSYLLPDRTRSSKQKTPVVKRSTNPSWNYTFIYEDVSLEDLSERALELTVWDHDRLASNEFLGGVRFSLGTCKSYGRQVDWMDASGKELSLWQNMLDRPNFWVEGSVILRSTLEGIRTMP